MLGESYTDLEECNKEAFKEAAVRHNDTSNHVLIYLDRSTGKYYHTCLMSRNNVLITTDRCIKSVGSYNPYDYCDQSDEELTWDEAIDFCYSKG